MSAAIKPLTGKKYKLDVARDVDTDEPENFILNLPNGFRFVDDLVHVRGFDSMQELRKVARQEVIQCCCAQCVK